MGDFHFAEDQLGLLNILVAPQIEAAAAFRRWSERHSVNTCTPEAKRQLSRVYARLRDAGASADEIQPIEEYWSAHELRAKALLRGLEIFLSSYKPPAESIALMKSSCLIALGFEPAGSRHMFDVDVLVRPSEAAAAEGALAELGWERIPNSGLEDPPPHAVEYRCVKVGRIDLHWRSLSDVNSALCEQSLWNYARPVLFCGHSVAVPQATDLLFQFCIHGYQRIQTRFDWAVDAHLLLQHEQAAVDWDRLVGLAKDSHVEHRLGKCFAFLRDFGAADIPAATISELARSSFSMLNVLDRLIEAKGTETTVGGLPYHLVHYFRVSNRQGFARWAGFISYLQRVWNVRGASQTIRRLFSTAIAIQKRRRASSRISEAAL